MLFSTKISSNITQDLQHFFLFSVIATEYLYNDFPKGGMFTVNSLQWDILEIHYTLPILYQYYRENFHAILFIFPANTIINCGIFFHPIRLFHTIRLFFWRQMSTQYGYSIPYGY